MPEIAEQLDVDAVIEGAVARSGQRVRITAQLIDARNDRHIWAQSYERDLSDVVALQGEVAREIAAAAKVELTPEERALLGRSQRVNPEAYAAFLQGISSSGSDSFEGFNEAIGHFEESAKKQPDFALPYAGMALMYYQFSYVGPYAPREFMPKVEAAARKALELDDALAGPHFDLGAVLYRYHWDWMAAEKEYRRAMELVPLSFQRSGYLEFLFLTGRAEEALTEAQRLRERDPLTAQRTLDVGNVFRASGQYDRAIAEYQKVLEKNPRIPRAHFHLGVAYVLKSELSEGIAELEKAVELSRGNPRYVAYLGYAYAVAGKTSGARKILQDLNARSRQQYVSPYGIALIHVGLGEKEAALTWLEKGYEAHAFELAEMKADSRLDPLRSDRRFQNLARRVGPALEYGGSMNRRSSGAKRNAK